MIRNAVKGLKQVTDIQRNVPTSLVHFVVYRNSENFRIRNFCNKNFHVNLISNALELAIVKFLHENFGPQKDR